MKTLPVVFLLLALFTPDIRAQKFDAVPYESDLLEARPVRYYIGLMPGLLVFDHQGTFSPNCDCSYGSKTGTRFLPAVEFLVHFPKRGYAFSLPVAWQDYSADFSQRLVRSTPVVGDGTDIAAEYERTSRVTLRLLTLTPSFVWYPGKKNLFVRAGIEIGLPLAARYDNTETIITEGVEYYDRTRIHVLQPETNIPGGKNLRFGAAFGLGLDVFLTDRLVLAPVVSVTIPLTPVSDADKDWKVLAGYAALVLKIRV